MLLYTHRIPKSMQFFGVFFSSTIDQRMKRTLIVCVNEVLSAALTASATLRIQEIDE